MAVIPVFSHWAQLAPCVDHGCEVEVSDDGLRYQGVLRRLRLLADGTALLRFTDGMVIELPALKGEG